MLALSFAALAQPPAAPAPQPAAPPPVARVLAAPPVAGDPALGAAAREPAPQDLAAPFAARPPVALEPATPESPGPVGPAAGPASDPDREERAGREIRPPITEVDHPRYVDAAGQPLRWSEVKELARGSDAIGLVNRRRVGRMLVRVMFSGATAVEAWGTAELAERELWTVYPLAGQTALTGLCAVLSFTNEPSAQVEDRALILGEVNRSLARRP